jgi:hypothetical protein
MPLPREQGDEIRGSQKRLPHLLTPLARPHTQHNRRGTLGGRPNWLEIQNEILHLERLSVRPRIFSFRRH